jgi:hypothetical protein
MSVAFTANLRGVTPKEVHHETHERHEKITERLIWFILFVSFVSFVISSFLFGIISSRDAQPLDLDREDCTGLLMGLLDPPGLRIIH